MQSDRILSAWKSILGYSRAVTVLMVVFCGAAVAQGASSKKEKAQAKPTKKEKETKAPVDQPSDDEEEINVGSHEEDDDQDTLNLRPISFPDGRNFLLDESNNSLYDPSCVDLDDFAPVATYRGNQWFPLTPSLTGLEAV